MRQQGSTVLYSLEAGKLVPVHWPDLDLPLQLNLRLQEPGWTWSGAVAMDSASLGDSFVKVCEMNAAVPVPSYGVSVGNTLWKMPLWVSTKWVCMLCIPQHSTSTHISCTSPLVVCLRYNLTEAPDAWCCACPLFSLNTRSTNNSINSDQLNKGIHPRFTWTSKLHGKLEMMADSMKEECGV